MERQHTSTNNVRCLVGRGAKKISWNICISKEIVFISPKFTGRDKESQRGQKHLTKFLDIPYYRTETVLLIKKLQKKAKSECKDDNFMAINDNWQSCNFHATFIKIVQMYFYPTSTLVHVFFSLFCGLCTEFGWWL